MFLAVIDGFIHGLMNGNKTAVFIDQPDHVVRQNFCNISHGAFALHAFYCTHRFIHNFLIQYPFQIAPWLSFFVAFSVILCAFFKALTLL